MLGMFVAILLIAQPLLRDFDLRHGRAVLQHADAQGQLPVGPRARRRDCSRSVVYVVVALGMMLGSFMPWLDPERIGPFSLAPYLWAFGVLIVPNLIFIGALLCLLAVTTRRLLSVFLGAMAFLVAVADRRRADCSDIQYDTIASLIDPFGARADGARHALLVGDRAQHAAAGRRAGCCC